MRVSSTTVQNAFGKYLKEAIEGNEVIITKNGEGVAKIVKHEEDRKLVLKEGAEEYYVRKRVTYDEYVKITDKSDLRYELIDGQLYLMTSPRHAHQKAITLLMKKLLDYLGEGHCIPMTSPYDVKLFNDSESFEEDPNVVQPDVLVICDEEKVNDNGYYEGVPTLVIEVLSPSSRTKDMLLKLSLYMKSGVKEYLIVDTENKQINHYFFNEHEIAEYIGLSENQEFKSFVYDGLIFKVGDVFK